MRIAIQALVIAVPFSAVVSIAYYTATVRWVAVMEEGVQTETLLGWEAVKYLVRENGLFSYLYGILPHYLFFAVSIFTALAIQGFVYARRSNS